MRHWRNWLNRRRRRLLNHFYSGFVVLPLERAKELDPFQDFPGPGLEVGGARVEAGLVPHLDPAVARLVEPAD